MVKSLTLGFARFVQQTDADLPAPKKSNHQSYTLKGAGTDGIDRIEVLAERESAQNIAAPRLRAYGVLNLWLSSCLPIPANDPPTSSAKVIIG
jgi:hypothetical protein